MLRTSSKKARENIRAYVLDHFDVTSYSPAYDYYAAAEADTAAGRRHVDLFSLAAHIIAECFYCEKLLHDARYNAGRISRQALFTDWAAGLPSIIDTCYYYNRSAVDDLAAILEETDDEKAKYTEAQAEELLTKLIYREIYSVKGVC